MRSFHSLAVEHSKSSPVVANLSWPSEPREKVCLLDLQGLLRAAGAQLGTDVGNGLLLQHGHEAVHKLMRRLRLGRSSDASQARFLSFGPRDSLRSRKLLDDGVGAVLLP